MTCDGRSIKQVRRELLMMLKVVYPTALPADVLFRALMGGFPQMAWEYLHKDLAYLVEKGYLIERAGSSEDQAGVDGWRRRVYRLSASGVEVVDRCIADVALEV